MTKLCQTLCLLCCAFAVWIMGEVRGEPPMVEPQVTEETVMEAVTKPVPTQAPTESVQETICEDVYEVEPFMEESLITEAEVSMIAKTVYGEARGSNTTLKSAVVWCILNRADAKGWTIAEVITQPNAFAGYKPEHPVTEELEALAKDVLLRWHLEKMGVGNVGRTLPKNYLWFRAKGGVNVFENRWPEGDEWDWSLPSPYDGG